MPGLFNGPKDRGRRGMYDRGNPRGDACSYNCPGTGSGSLEEEIYCLRQKLESLQPQHQDYYTHQTMGTALD